MKFTIKGKPIGISAPQSAFEALHDLSVEAEQVGDKIIVSRNEIIQKLKEKGSMFLKFWRKLKLNQNVEFQMT